ncbi:nucleotidyltransferase domain-containing protein [Pyrobaculum aerophilum]|uniref:Polymerase nucleotidyl transferase domain-containing protein n=2 Tax=Pyrobaculum aerophilum TaxID=13773 RepID=Q8ZZW6_PYRAE|nr:MULTISPECIES: nucleotidyltransferase domain-containing protein [Pyrobaculum]AAL62523.1 hypothetical protein PAE0045 [Pyrobaculum aerophilum str. IM2]MCX8136604.1 nucleotidyltransferase domain-containing protein [Pyrobaculum aerophilum]HII47747.1 nucleotidyltransferase domain-containing protein [Pyrobaculum aerophilum]
MSRGFSERSEGAPPLSPEEIEEAVKIAMEAGAVAIYLFGSAARGKFVRGLSDIDLLVVTESPPPYRAKTKHIDAGDVNIIYMSIQEVCIAYMRGNSLVREALEEGKLVWGREVKCR